MNPGERPSPGNAHVEMKDIVVRFDEGYGETATAEEVAQLLKVSTASVYDHADRKQPAIPCVHLDKSVRFRPEDVRTSIEP